LAELPLNVGGEQLRSHTVPRVLPQAQLAITRCINLSSK